MISNDVMLNEAVFEAICACLGLGPESVEANRLIHQGYVEAENAPQPPRERDVIYYWVERDETSGDDAQMIVPSVYNWKRQKWNETWGDQVPTEVLSFLAYRLVIVSYGPNSEEYAHRIRALMYLDGVRKPRGILRMSGIYPVPRPAQAMASMEPAGSLWRRRADLVISLRVKDKVETVQEAVIVAPEVKIIDR